MTLYSLLPVYLFNVLQNFIIMTTKNDIAGREMVRI